MAAHASMGNMVSTSPASEVLCPATESAKEAVEPMPPVASTAGNPCPDEEYVQLVATRDDTYEHLREIWKEGEMKAKNVGGRNRPLQLLDLPVDVLKEIIKEVSAAFHSQKCLIAEASATIDHPHKRSYFPSSNLLCLTWACNTVNLLTLRYCVARCAQQL